MINIGDDVYVPRSRLDLDLDAPSALVKTRVQNRHARTLVVDVPGTKGLTREIPSSCAHKNLAIYLMTIGDYATETSVLLPLSASVRSICQLLLPPDAFTARFVRSRAEFQHYWQLEHAAFSHVILVGHGSEQGLEFAVDKHVSTADIIDLIQGPNPTPKTFISLCCQTGRKAFAKPVSDANFCSELVAPYHSVHGAVASEFTHVLLGQHLLGGRSIKVAFNKADIEHPGKERFRFWQRGRIK